MRKENQKWIIGVLMFVLVFIFGNVIFAQEETQSPSHPFFRIQVRPEGPYFDTSVVKWYPDLIPALDDTETTPNIVVFKGDYYSPGGLTGFIQNKTITGWQNPIPTTPISKKELAEPAYNANVRFALALLGNSRLENLTMLGRSSGKNASGISGDNNQIINCYVDGRANKIPWGILIGGDGRKRIDGCIVRDCRQVGIGVSGINIVKPTAIRKNVFFNNGHGLYYTDASGINLGEVTKSVNDPGENVFNMNEKNMRVYYGKFTPAQGNYWYGCRGSKREGERLTTEAEILDTIELVNPTPTGNLQIYRTPIQELMSYLETISVVPYQEHDHPLFSTITAVKSWTLYK